MEENQSPQAAQKNELMTLLKNGKPNQIISSPIVADRFISLYTRIHGRKDGESYYESNKFHILKLLAEKPDLAACTAQSIYGAFLDASVNGLSFDPSMKHMYLIAYSVNTAGRNQPPVWEKRAQLQISGPGELILRQRAGQIKYADNPQLVYADEPFKVITKGGKTTVEHEITFPRKSDEVIGCYMSITRIDGSVDYKVMDVPEVLKLKQWGKDNANSKAWSDLGLPGMLVAKTIKHAFKTYPKVRTGDYSKMQSETVDAEVESVSTESIPEKVDYGFVDTYEEEKPVSKKGMKDTVKPKEKSSKTIDIKPEEKEPEEFDPEEADATLTGKNTKSQDGVRFEDDEDNF